MDNPENAMYQTKQTMITHISKPETIISEGPSIDEHSISIRDDQSGANRFAKVSFHKPDYSPQKHTTCSMDDCLYGNVGVVVGCHKSFNFLHSALYLRTEFS